MWMTWEERQAMQDELIRKMAERQRQLLEETIAAGAKPKVAQPDCGCRGIVHTCNSIA